MTLDEKIRLVTGYMGLPAERSPELNADIEQYVVAIPPSTARGTCGFVQGVERLGIPDLHMEGAGAGLANIFERRDGAAVAFPAPLAQSATWNPSLKRLFGRRLAAEARDQGINVLLGGACNLVIEPRCGRAFEYHGEDPLLAGAMVAEEVIGVQEEGLLGSIKHFAANFQETGRFLINSIVDERALREGELLAFEIAITRSKAAAVMAAYNLINGTYACEHSHLINDVLKGEWRFDGWVMSDWGAAHSTVESAVAGLDQEFPHALWFGSALRDAVEAGEVPLARLEDMNGRILGQLKRFELIGALDTERVPFDVEASYAAAQAIAEESIVLLTNNGLLPLAAPRGILLVGSHADAGVPAGGGSSGVEPRGGSAVPVDRSSVTPQVWVPSSPLEGLREEFPQSEINYVDGADLQEVLDLASRAEIVVIFAHQWRTEGLDVTDLALPDSQETLIEAVASAHDRVVVVLESGGAVLTPWRNSVSAVLSAWYPGHRGGRAIARVLSGAVNPSGKLPITFPDSEADLPHPIFRDPHAGESVEAPDLVNLPSDNPHRFDAHYTEGLDIGYKWYPGRAEPAFPFGHGLSYTNFEIDLVSIDFAETATVTVAVRNVGSLPGMEVVQLYATLPNSAGPAPRRLVGWAKVAVDPNRSSTVTIVAEPRTLEMWNVELGAWDRPRGEFRFDVGSSSARPSRTVTVLH
jgi:beta-glucosidase